MIRFLPDTWRDALLRPLAMAAPNGGVYVETIAPDFRFVFVLVILVLLAIRHRRELPRLPFALLGFCALAFVPWLATTGNGRYFLPLLLLVGPLCVVLLHQLRVTRNLQLAMLLAMIGLQLFLVRENAPWNSWGLVPWKEAPAFAVEVPADLKARPATYVTLSGISYSLVAPQFHPASRWISLASQRGGNDDSVDARRTRAFLQASRDASVLFPSLPGQRVLRSPPELLLVALNDSLAAHGFEVPSGERCRFLPSYGLTQMGNRMDNPPITAEAQLRGFWLCPMAPVAAGSAPRRAPASPEVEAVFEKVERTCPRMFRPGEAVTSMLPMGARRFYPDSDMRLYVLTDGTVMFKYMRALNPVQLGAVKDVLSDAFRLDCNNVRGRAGLPWEREI